MKTCSLTFLRDPRSGRRQEVDRIEDRDGWYVLRAEVEGPDAVDDLRRELRRLHVRRSQLTQRDAAVDSYGIIQWPTQQPLHHLPPAGQEPTLFRLPQGDTEP